ncbi:hypothetical protein SAMN05216359_102596 [Roseateles sp. YR242]|uniref:zinc-binding metallopeptidase family protein n=1 Tax=Roseateles sp. YR242 TaxID=1855305 RepID=UPI0008CD0380|nr:putative zinc-binding metallopeptidase [Roseateles sp. YR242]SEK66341.1 hypothetical protein SAMN05216359_102596 [Roseateles sp. YR242]
MLARNYLCRCSMPVFFRNSACLSCGSPLGYLPEDGTLHALHPTAHPDHFRIHGHEGATFRRCANFSSAAGCNWLVQDEGLHTPTFCLACSLSRTIPDLSFPVNAELWRRMESAKRRLVSQLLGLGLPVVPRFKDPAKGLAFDFLRAEPGKRVITGHAAGVITINIEEADDAKREKTRAEFGEPYRTLLGHFRHEIGHYYWDRLVAQTSWLVPFRQLFGDERQDYAGGLRRNYERGPPPDWRKHFISAYASAHPWEDWAETWAHYLHLRDTIDTAISVGILGTARPADGHAHEESIAGPFSERDLWQRDHATGAEFLTLVRDWVAVTCVMNEMSRAMGLPDFYPFVLPAATVPKLHFIHCLIDAQINPTLSLPSEVARTAGGLTPGPAVTS